MSIRQSRTCASPADMSDSLFSLIPFADAKVPAIQITGKARRESQILTVQYALTGACENLLFPEITPQPKRRDDLWKASCFEFFLAIPNQPQYWEFNMSPSGDWNVYHMDAYRRVGFREEASFQQLQFLVQREPGRVSMDVTIDLSSMVPPGSPVQLGINCVIQTSDGHESYWALAHPNPQPDFHRRDSFVILL